jgi:hypothetical protein
MGIKHVLGNQLFIEFIIDTLSINPQTELSNFPALAQIWLTKRAARLSNPLLTHEKVSKIA